MSKRTTAAVWVKGIAEMLAAEGLDVRALLAAAGIDPAALDAPGARLPTEKISRLWELAVERSGNPAIGLAQHQVARPASFDVVGYAMMSCANLRAAFERLIRYLLILSDALTMTMREEPAGYRVTFVLFGGDSAGAAAAHRVHFRHGDRLLPAGSVVATFIHWRSNCHTRRRSILRPTEPLFAARCRSTHPPPACCLQAPT